MNLIQFLRQYKIGDFAIFDITTAFLGVWLISPLLSAGLEKVGLIVPITNWLWLTIPIGVLTHIALGISTPLTERLFDPSGFYLWKLALVGMIVMGLLNIKLAK